MIGVFDSGYGGLTILHTLMHQLPSYSYVYYGDNAHAPYGERTTEDIYQLTRTGVEYLLAQNCKLIILGCNTASAIALRRLQQEIAPPTQSDIRILGIIIPTIEQITGTSWYQETATTSPINQQRYQVGVLATASTVESGVYPTEIHKRNPSISVAQVASPTLVKLIESNGASHEIDREIGDCLRRLQHQTEETMHALLLGCTHYELIAHQIHQQLPTTTKLYRQPTIVAQSLARYLKHHYEFAKIIQQTSTQQFITTGDSDLVSRQASRYFGSAIKFSRPPSSSAPRQS